MAVDNTLWCLFTSLKSVLLHEGINVAPPLHCYVTVAFLSTSMYILSFMTISLFIGHKHPPSPDR